MPTGTQVQYYHLCHRKLWLFSHQISMEQSSELVAEGKLIDEQAYPQRAERWQALQIESIKIDHYDAQLGIVREVKKSNRRVKAHEAQLKYYMAVLQRNGVAVNHGILEYPKLRQTEELYLAEEDQALILQWEKAIADIIAQPLCPPRIKQSLCKYCAYFDFCFSE
ncbi:MAG: CRISPR-associated protein Cas4 [Bacteroidota bacterium]